MSKPNQSFYHLGFRYSALASKPALIWLLVVSGSSAAAVEIGSLMLVATLLGMAMSNEAHLKYYATHFSDRRLPAATLFRHLTEYIQSLTVHILLILPLAAAACLLFFPKVSLTLAISLAVAERIADEVLRFRLYRKEWNSWTTLLLAKNLIPAAVAVAALAAIGQGTGVSYVMAAVLFALVLIAIEGPPVHAAMKAAIAKIPDFAFIRSYLKTYVQVLSARQIAAILSMNVILLDRYVGMTVWSEQDAAYLLFAGQLVNGIFFALEAKYLSEQRANFINQNITLEAFWRWKPYIFVLLGCIITAIIVFSAGNIFTLLPRADNSMFVSLCFMILNYALFYVTIPFNDFLYYRGQAGRLAAIHTAIFAIYAISVVSLAKLSYPPFSLAMLTVILLARLLLLANMHSAFEHNRRLGDPKWS